MLKMTQTTDQKYQEYINRDEKNIKKINEKILSNARNGPKNGQEPTGYRII